MNQIFTIGYEGADLTDFIDTLEANNIQVLLDVRELPVSRRKGFSKTALAQAVQAAGLEYRHEKALGSPREIRHKLREDGDYTAYFISFETYLEGQSALISQLAAGLRGNVALMCYEKDPLICHRRVVAKAFGEKVNRKPKHLGVSPARKAACANDKEYAFS